VAPGSGHGLPDLYGHMRTSTADRERAIDVLKTAFTEGRLTIQECEQRVGQALNSRTYAELAALTADLPAGQSASLIPHPVAYLPAPASRPPVNGLAVASIFFAVLPGLPLLAVFAGLIAHGQIQERGERGAGLATAGMILGGFFSMLFVLLVLRP
jgi:Domain of unknown function (DUF1707)/Domain of unknown function (DUF4190)